MTGGAQFVVAGCPLRERAWCADRHAAALLVQAHPPNACYWLVNDTTDDTAMRLFDATRGQRRVVSVIENCDTGDTAGHSRVEPQRYSTANIARVRNEWLARALELWPQATHVWSVDSDVLPDPDVLEKLLAADKAIVAAVVRNSTAEVYNFFSAGEYTPETGALTPRRQGIEGLLLERRFEPFAVTMTGACVLIRRDVLDVGVRYAEHSRGEDVAWSMAAREAGFGLWVHPLARTSHLQPNGEVWR